MSQFMMTPMASMGGFVQPVAPQGNAQWIVTAEERANHDIQFQKLGPVAGFLRGDQARNFLLQSKIPPPVLGKIWELADFSGDGKMDKLEFSIAMKLIKLQIQGVMLPNSLPYTMKQPPAKFPGTSVIGSTPGIMAGIVSAPPMSYSSNPGISNGGMIGINPVLSMSSTLPQQTQPGVTNSLSRHNSISESHGWSQEWAVPKQTKLKYNQVFNTNDRNKTGFLSGMQARHILSGTGLPQVILASIWQLSDIDNDGKLTQEEFVLAMHLADTAKAGNPLPSKLPPQLVPPAYRNSQTQQPVAVGGGPGQLGLMVPLTKMASVKPEEPADVLQGFVSFEDRRKDNFQKGNLELEKRRQALLESQQKEKERLERKEREEREKREKERQEQERRRTEQLERELERQRAAEREREEQRRKLIEQKEAAQREMERQRQMEWERLRRKELLQHKLREQENVASLRAKRQTMDMEFNSLQEKKTQLQQRVRDLEGRLSEQNNALKLTNKQRELKLTLVQKQQEQIELFNHQLNQLMPEKQVLMDRIQFKGNTGGESNHIQITQRDYQSKVFLLQRLRTTLSETKSKKQQDSTELQTLHSQLNKLKEDLNKQVLAAESLHRTQQDKIRDLQEARRQKDIQLTRKNSMQEHKKRQEKLASDVLVRRQEAEARFKVGEEARRKREEEQKLQMEEQRRKSEEEYEKRKKEEEEGAKRKAEEESKKAEMKKKIMEMQKERLKQKQVQQEATYATVNKPNSNAAPTKANNSTNGHRGFALKLSTNQTDLVKFRALYSFTARNPDELSITAGDIIIVDKSQIAEPDWLAGSKDGKSGWFPANYVEQVKASVPAVQPLPQSAKPTNNKKQPSQVSALPIQTSQGSAFSSANKTATANNALQAPTIGQRYRAVYPWIAKKENHLTFEKDDVIAVSEMQDMWWYGHCQGKSGWFPKSYVKATSSTTPINQTIRPSSPKSSPVAKRKAPPPPSGGESNAAAKKNYIALYAFAGTERGDLSFNVDDVITVSEMEGEWWTGTLGGKTGIFPASYVSPKPQQQQQQQETSGGTNDTQILSKPEVATVIAAYQAGGSEQLTLQVGQLVSVRKKNKSGWWEGELQARGKKKQVGWFPANYVKLLSASGSDVKKSKSKTPTPAPIVYKVMALYDYAQQNSDELTFQRGDVIIIIDKSDADWWKGSLEKSNTSGLFPSNYVQEIANKLGEQRSSTPAMENEYPYRVKELIESEETYLKDLQLADDAFHKPLRQSKLVTDSELNTLFVNLNDLIMISAKLVKAFRVRCTMSGENSLNLMIGDILCEQIPHLHPYIRFCSCQLNASALLQEKFDSDADFKALVKKCESGDQWKGLPVSSYLVKPMQRITKYPLLIKKILKNTTESHPDHRNLSTALEKAEELCQQVNEGVRQKENSDRLEWLQTHVILDGLNDKLVFNSNTNCLAQRKFLYCGMLYKLKSNKELVGFLFNDFLLLTTPTKPLTIPANDKMFGSKSCPQFKLYKTPIFLNELLTRLPNSESSNPDESVFHLSHIEHVYTLKAESTKERTIWMNKIKEAAELYVDTEKKKRDKAYQARTQRGAGIGRLVVTIVEGCNLVKTSSGRHDPYCEVTMGEQCHTTKTIPDTLNPRWGSTMQFFVKDINQDVLCISVFQRYMFSPDDFLGRTEVKLSNIQAETEASKDPITKRLLLHEVDAGEVVVKLDLLLFEVGPP